MTLPSDPLFSQQWHLSMLGDIGRVWRDYTGAGVAVAVYDDGVQFTHEDIAANYDASGHFTYGGTTYVPTPNSTDDAHGTSCAGLIAAVANNGVGGTGVAFGASITGLDYLNDLQFFYNWNTQTSSARYDAAMRWAANFDVMSNSWGTNPDYSDELNPTIAGNSSAVDAAHFAWVSAHGRGGLGTVVVKAAGNETMNANGDAANVSRHTITVAATERNGYVADYSNFGASILLAAPAAAVTTDLMAAQGYGSGNYTRSFGGTSAATPVISGVAALMLDANAGLGWRDVQTILTLSAAHTGSAVGAAPSGAEVGRWLTMGGEHWNGGGEIYHLSYGFGMVDAYAAVRMAEVWTRMTGGAQTSANEAHLVCRNGNTVAIADADGAAATPEARVNLRVAGNIDIESVQVTFDITHSYAPDLLIQLRSPTGALMTLFDREGGGALMDGGFRWTFAAEAFRGMEAEGTWRLLVHDRAAGDTGQISNVRLDFYGAAASTNDIHTFTDDFRSLRNLQADRRVIEDSNGGIDWLNFAAVTGNLSVRMAAGGAIRIDGTQLASFAARRADFEHLQAGDGADSLTGNFRANRIFGGRGSDRLSGAGGADRLMGEQGNDRLTGGDGADRFEFRRGFGHDTITDWTDNTDTLRLDDAIWGGGLTASEVISRFATVEAGDTVLSFGAAMSITLKGLANPQSLLDDIAIF